MTTAKDHYSAEQRALEEQLAHEWAGWPDEYRAFLEAHFLAVLSTGRRDGSPQASVTGYLLDDDGDLIISTKSYTAKYRNVLRQPRVSLVVLDGRTSLVVYGTATVVEQDPERNELTAKIFARAGAPVPEDPSRVVLRVRPRSFAFHT
ncbi:TIGR03618 family F420-dependent PPOX class oxidoreductase [Streptomyces griseorubiginosus]|uniref:TIGR03618 family F420-dependent PPOX class oxidoreductase n=1 Tax=Streptomyces griseorubiginosus TaxID=67304 RepID=UPI001AD7607F|nr:TIGR03618 family F420-dependent PPOX class oxidoreductase [Streptomyces griseorubiginosus]MBO4254086.1 TIGR03618 family F420-dependent PPOX class oxidoreductase [Streptomyces griseorubiginosus]